MAAGINAFAAIIIGNIALHALVYALLASWAIDTEGNQ